MATDKVCVVTGVGPGTGTALARRFADDGYRVALLARDAARLDTLAVELPGSKAFPVDIAELDALKQTLARIRTELVVIDAVIDVPWTRQMFANRPDDKFIQPKAIADAVHHVVHQERSGWTSSSTCVRSQRTGSAARTRSTAPRTIAQR